ncbi:conserved hypothetical protein [Ricinus communis]|uniref:Uncharacterized protein n=1 Tax=Ricinus communis TaxID=3988 RepID=B9TFF7_RICCO|nr:conserved hypothetical protein [Ricinus communis]
MPWTDIRWPMSSRPMASAAGDSRATRIGMSRPMPCQPVENTSIATTTENTSIAVCAVRYHCGFHGRRAALPSASQAMNSASKVARMDSRTVDGILRACRLMPPCLGLAGAAREVRSCGIPGCRARYSWAEANDAVGKAAPAWTEEIP